ncbi:MAG: hypothetical protein CMP98_06355 [Gammaproteobacteria bacterium]|nr:hypothetical protein [Gammaproteobacteria bacterium]OUU09970.1 MAG: hypothetical protein CBB94_06450 [Gammaproteobacteria bacterium TMED34]
MLYAPLFLGHTDRWLIVDSIKRSRHRWHPAISVGVYGYPFEDAVGVTVQAVRAPIDVNGPMSVTFCSFSSEDASAYERLLRTD